MAICAAGRPDSERTIAGKKQTILHMKAPILSFLELEGQGRGIIMGMPCLLPVKFLLSGKK
jgi:hypothetical protein